MIDKAARQLEKYRSTLSLLILFLVTLLLLAIAAGMVQGGLQYVSKRTQKVMWEIYFRANQLPVGNDRHE